MAFTINKGIPIPDRNGRPYKYPFKRMAVGDCFDVPLEDDNTANKVRVAARMYGKKNGGKFIIRTLRDDGIVRCWRTATDNQTKNAN